VLFDAICRPVGRVLLLDRLLDLQPHSSKHVTLARSRIVSSSQSSRVAPRDPTVCGFGRKQDDVSGYSAGGRQHRGPISVSVLERVKWNGVSEEKENGQS
jgi:hypothetical protein